MAIVEEELKKPNNLFELRGLEEMFRLEEEIEQDMKSLRSNYRWEDYLNICNKNTEYGRIGGGKYKFWYFTRKLSEISENFYKKKL